MLGPRYVLFSILPLFVLILYLKINLCNIISIDLAAIQTLYKIKCMKEKQGKIICLESEFTKEYKNLITVSGLLPIVNSSKLIA